MFIDLEMYVRINKDIKIIKLRNDVRESVTKNL